MGRGGLTQAGRRGWIVLPAAGLLTLLLAGCGSRTIAPQVTRPAPPGGLRVARYPGVGFSLALPRDWTSIRVRAPLIALVTSDRAAIALWRYPLKAPAPRTSSELGQTSRRLIAAARGRRPGLRLLDSATAPVSGYPAVEVQTVQRIGRQLRQVRSTHVFGRGEEVVLEESAPVGVFGGLDRSVFSAVRRSLAALRP